MLGHLMEWFYASLLGIGQEFGSVGYRKILLAPTIVGDLQHASGFYNSPNGVIRSSWKKEAHRFVWAIQIPENTTARIVLPIKQWKRLILDQKEVAVKELQRLGSGVYQILVEF